ncbi:hypothetical protein [Sphingopyxis sp. NJF-3]
MTTANLKAAARLAREASEAGRAQPVGAEDACRSAGDGAVSREQEIAAIKADWKRLVDSFANQNSQGASLAVALWATLNIDKLIALAEQGR